MAVRKTKVPLGVYNPFWTKETIEAFGSGNIRGFSSPVVVSTMNYTNTDYLPFYTLPILPPRTIDNCYFMMDGCKEGVFPTTLDRYVREGVVARDTKISALTRRLWDEKRYFAIFRIISSLTDIPTLKHGSLVTGMRSAWEEFIYEPINTNMYLPHNPTCTGSTNIVKQCKIGSHNGMGIVHSKLIKTGPWAHPRYSYGRYFIGHMVDIAATGQPRFTSTASLIERDYGVRPLLSLMFKVENIRLIRGYMLNNKEIPANLLELWVDESLDSLASPHPIRMQYIKTIKKPIIEAGVEIKIVPNLEAIMFERRVIPKFKSIRMQGEWVKSMVEQALDKERRRLGTKGIIDEFIPPMEVIDLGDWNDEQS